MKETPYLIFKEKILEENYRKFEELCDKYLKDYIISYSVKTNSFDNLINKLDELGSNFEVASMEEIIKVPKKFIVFNGSCKTKEELKKAISGNFLINADSKSEIDKIINLINGDKLEIGLRVSLKNEKFGFEKDKILEIIDYCIKNNLKVVGLSFHSGTQVTLKNYEDFIKEIENIVDKIKNKIDLKYLDFGGGFPDKYQLKNLNVSLEYYFKLMSNLRKFNVKIILEPGRILVSDVFDLITKVNVIKNKDGKTYAIINVGINFLGKMSMTNYKFEKVEDKEKNEKKEYILAGPLLFGNDIIGKFYGYLEEGDLIKISNVGAYCYNLAWEISYKKPKVFVE